MKDWYSRRRRKHIPNKDKGDHPFKVKMLCGRSIFLRDPKGPMCKRCLKISLK